MQDTQRIMNDLEKIIGMLEKVMERLGVLENRMDALENRMDVLESRMDALDSRMNSLEIRVDELEISLNRRIDETEQRLISRFDEKLEVWEFALDTEIQKVYEIAVENQSNIQLLLLRQSAYYKAINESYKIAELDERMSTVEGILREHTLEIRSFRSIIA